MIEGYVLIDAGPATNALQSAIMETSRRKGIDLTFAKNVPTVLTHTGVGAVKGQTIYLPVGKHYGRIGAMAERDILAVFKGIGAQVVNAAIMNAADWNHLYALLTGEFADSRTRWPVFQVYARKPSNRL